MLITIENTRTQKQTQIEVTDDFYTESEDMLIRIGMEQFKLVTTKSEEDQKRESLAVEFGETYYKDLYDKFPDFGSENCLLTREACKDIIKSKLTGKFEELYHDKNPEMILNSLVTAFGNYCQVKKEMDARDAEIRKSRKHENVFFDYILRLEEVFNNATTVKEISEGITKNHEYASLDERELFGYAIIFEQLKPFFDWSAETDKELKEMSPYKPIAEQAFFDDADYYTNHVKAIANKVENNLVNLKHTYDVWINEKMQQDGNSFSEYLIVLKNLYNGLYTKYESLKSEVSKKEEDQNVTTLMEAKDAFQNEYKEFIRSIVTFRIQIELDPRGFENDDQKNFLLSHCSLIDFWYNQITSNKEPNSGDRFMVQLGHHIPVVNKLIEGNVDLHKLMSGGYTQDELKELMEISTNK